jgi:hypothetical protein
MKLKHYSLALVTVMLVSCGNDDASKEKKDTANMLNDTFPAGPSTVFDTQPGDLIEKDSLNRPKRK